MFKIPFWPIQPYARSLNVACTGQAQGLMGHLYPTFWVVVGVNQKLKTASFNSTSLFCEHHTPLNGERDLRNFNVLPRPSYIRVYDQEALRLCQILELIKRLQKAVKMSADSKHQYYLDSQQTELGSQSEHSQ